MHPEGEGKTVESHLIDTLTFKAEVGLHTCPPSKVKLTNLLVNPSNIILTHFHIDLALHVPKWDTYSLRRLDPLL